MPCTYGFLSTYPPTQCGLATFTAALMRSLVSPEFGDSAGVVRVVDTPVRSQAPEVVGHLHTQAPAAHLAAATALNTFDIAVVQHEFGIFGGPDGDQLLAVLDAVRVPVITVAHIVPASPTPHQREVLEQVVAASAAVVVMTNAARDRLIAGYRVDADKVSLIPHGAVRRGDGGGMPTPGSRPLILTWGLLGPGKGIEWSLRALARLQSLDPAPTYTVAGRTHPKVLALHGERYRAGLYQLGAQLGVSTSVSYDAVYRDDASLNKLIRSADVVVLPYDSREQVTSGVLVEAVAAGIPVVATTFPHAVELLTDGPGLLVPHENPRRMAAAIRRVLTEPGLAAKLSGRNRTLAPTMLWPAVAARYETLARHLLAAGSPAVVAVAA